MYVVYGQKLVNWCLRASAERWDYRSWACEKEKASPNVASKHARTNVNVEFCHVCVYLRRMSVKCLDVGTKWWEYLRRCHRFSQFFLFWGGDWTKVGEQMMTWGWILGVRWKPKRCRVISGGLLDCEYGIIPLSYVIGVIPLLIVVGFRLRMSFVEWIFSCGVFCWV